MYKSSHPEVFVRKGALKICRKFTGEHPCRSVISIKLLCIITLRHGCSPVNLRHIFRIPFYKNASGWLLLNVLILKSKGCSMDPWGTSYSIFDHVLKDEFILILRSRPNK